MAECSTDAPGGSRHGRLMQQQQQQAASASIGSLCKSSSRRRRHAQRREHKLPWCHSTGSTAARARVLVHGGGHTEASARALRTRTRHTQTRQAQQAQQASKRATHCQRAPFLSSCFSLYAPTSRSSPRPRMLPSSCGGYITSPAREVGRTRGFGRTKMDQCKWSSRRMWRQGPPLQHVRLLRCAYCCAHVAPQGAQGSCTCCLC